MMRAQAYGFPSREFSIHSKQPTQNLLFCSCNMVLWEKRRWVESSFSEPMIVIRRVTRSHDICQSKCTKHGKDDEHVIVFVNRLLLGAMRNNSWHIIFYFQWWWWSYIFSLAYFRNFITHCFDDSLV